MKRVDPSAKKSRASASRDDFNLAKRAAQRWRNESRKLWEYLHPPNWPEPDYFDSGYWIVAREIDNPKIRALQFWSSGSARSISDPKSKYLTANAWTFKVPACSATCWICQRLEAEFDDLSRRSGDLCRDVDSTSSFDQLLEVAAEYDMLVALHDKAVRALKLHLPQARILRVKSLHFDGSPALLFPPELTDLIHDFAVTRDASKRPSISQQQKLLAHLYRAAMDTMD